MTQSVSNSNSLSCCKWDSVLLIETKAKSESNFVYDTDERNEN